MLGSRAGFYIDSTANYPSLAYLQCGTITPDDHDPFEVTDCADEGKLLSLSDSPGIGEVAPAVLGAGLTTAALAQNLNQNLVSVWRTPWYKEPAAWVAALLAIGTAVIIITDNPTTGSITVPIP